MKFTAIVIFSAVLHGLFAINVTAAEPSWKNQSLDFCDSMVWRRDHGDLSAYDATKICRAYIGEDALRQQVAAYIYCSEFHDVRWFDVRGGLPAPGKLRKKGCAVTAAEINKYNALMLEAGFKDAPWATWPLKPEIQKENELRMHGISRPKHVVTKRRFGPRGALVVLPYLVDLNAAGLCKAYGKGETRMGHVRTEIEEEIRRRGVLSDEEWEAARSRRPEVGMPLCVAQVAFPPASKLLIPMRSGSDKTPKPSTSIYECQDGDDPQLPFCPATAVVTLDGVITKIEPYESD